MIEHSRLLMAALRIQGERWGELCLFASRIFQIGSIGRNRRGLLAAAEANRFGIGVFAIIFDERGRVLLCHRRDIDIWNLPGGGVESGELATEAVIRETKEETGLEAVVERLTGVYGKNDRDELVFAFVCQVVGGRLCVTDEADESVYFEMESLPVNTIPKHVERIHDAVEDNMQPVFRRQDVPSTREFLKMLESKHS